MFPSYLSNYAAYENESLAEGYWKLKKQEKFLMNTILTVLDMAGHYIGSMTYSNFEKRMDLDGGTVGEYCNRNAKYCVAPPPSESYSREEAALIFAENPHIHALPVIDANNNLVDIAFRHQIFYSEFYQNEKLPRMHYATQIFEAATLAKHLGYKAISVIEFGVAGGNGLINCEFHAREISRICGVDIEIYGFDTGEGIPSSEDYRNVLFSWPGGSFKMDVEYLKKRLRFSKLVIGDVNETCKEFMENQTFAPIGTILVDVDHYTSTVPILNMLLGDTRKFLPRVYMYFDDIGYYYEHIGESLAISDFNDKNKDVKVSKLMGVNPTTYTAQKFRCYCAQLFKHEKYNSYVPMQSGYTVIGNLSLI